MKKVIKWFFLSLLCALLICTVYEQIAQLYFNAKKPDATSFSENIHFVKKGSGGPTVVFQSGLGGDYKIWNDVQDSLSRYTTTISYDRAGLMWSGPSNETKTLDNITAELYQLLERTNCPKPYILVGHSLAGLTLRPFVRDHQKDVQALVFLDVAHPLQIKKSSEELKKYLVVPPTWLMATLIETGVIRTYFSFKPFVSDLPRSHWMNKHVRDYFYTSYRTFLQEAVDDDRMFGEAGAIQSFDSIPLTVITGAYPNGADFLSKPELADEYLRIHRENQKDLLHLSANSKQVIAPNSAHYIPLTDPDVVINAVKEYLK